MHVGVFLRQLEPQRGGAFTFQETILAALLRTTSSHRFTVFTYGDVTPHLGNHKVSFVQLHREPEPSGWFSKARQFRELLRSFAGGLPVGPRPEALHRAVLEAGIDLAWFPSQVYEYVEVPYIFTVWDLQHRLQSWFPEVSVTGSTFDSRERSLGHAIPRASFVIASNPAALEEVHQFYRVPRERIKLLPQPTSDFVFQDAPQGADLQQVPEAPFLFYPAQFWPHKNHVVLLEALSILKKEHGLVLTTVFSGADKGNEAYVRQYAEKLGLSGQLRFPGFVPAATLVALYRKAFALVFPSFFGPENMPPLEAFALGCPVIASAVSGSEYQLKDAALLFDPKDERALASHILQLHGDPALRARLVAAGRQRAESRRGDQYIEGLLAIVDDFAAVRRCWSSETRYIHS
jgi:glycosyltransferase involved in cell wall biosynthesis